MKRMIGIVWGICVLIGLSAQKHDFVWKSGRASHTNHILNGGFDINFNSSPPDTTFIYREIDFISNSASVCDTAGNFLFSSNGCIITGFDDEMLLHGDSLNPGYYFNEFCDTTNSTSAYPTAQDIFFLPSLTDTNQYYLIHVGLGYVEGLGTINQHIYYTLLDKTLNNGHGDVVEKNVVILEDTMSLSCMSAVRHANGEDWWIIAAQYATDNYIFLRMTTGSIFESHRQWIGTFDQEDGQTGQNTFSPDGNWFARFGRENGLALYRFNRCEGSLHEPLYDIVPSAPDSSISTGGVAFSPDSRLLYLVTNLWIYQYDLWADDIIGSKVRVATWDGTLIPPNNVAGFFFLPQLAPDGRIYISSTNSIPFFHVIEKPNERGVACQVNQLGFPVPRRNAFVTPYFPNYRLGPLGPGGCDSLPTSLRVLPDQPAFQFDIYPNPTTQTRVHLRFYNHVQAHDQLVVLDLYGREIHRQTAELDQVDISNWPKGVYIIQWRRKGLVLTAEKLLRQ